ncbi:MAG: ribokinase [Sedimentisphaerales bacterium]|nr:ribokinase [Sedimentisphaerales bacterium]
MNGRKPKVVVVGGTYIDITIKCDVIPAGGQSVSGSAFSLAVSGAGPRQAIQAALCGCNVHLISKVGGGSLSEAARMNLEEYQVNTDYVYTAEAKNTGILMTMVDTAGKNACCVYEGANTSLLEREITAAEQIIANADVCLIHGKLPQQAIVSAIRLAKLSNTKIILNPARPIETENLKSDLLMEYFDVDIIIPNLYEAADITEQSTANIRTAKMIGSDLIARGAGTAIITMGRRGCVIVDRNSADHIPAFEVELVDQTGCGDAFAGALAAYVAVKDDIKGAVEFASAAGALVCTKFGSIESLPTRAEIIELLQKHS